MYWTKVYSGKLVLSFTPYKGPPLSLNAIGSDTVSCSREGGWSIENADVGQTALAISFVQQDSVLTEFQIESLQSLNTYGFSIVLDVRVSYV